MQSQVNVNRYVPSFMNGHFDYIETANCEVFYTVTPDARGKFVAIAFTGKGKNSSWFYNFSTEERMNDYISKYVDNRKAIEESNRLEKLKKKKANAEVKANVGDIFYTSYGYDQTNINFYMITDIKSKTATIVEIGTTVVKGSEGFMCCNVTPNKEKIISEPFTKILKASYDGSPTFKISSFEHAHLTDETTSKYCSWYA